MNSLYGVLHRLDLYHSAGWLRHRDRDSEVVSSSPGQDRILILIFLCLSKIQLSMMIGSSSDSKSKQIY